MSGAARPHVLGIDDAPFDKGQHDPVPIVGVMMEGCDLVESIAIGAFPVDGDGATDFLGDWISGLRAFSSVQAIVLGGITIAGLGLIDIESLSTRLGVPVLTVTRRDPATSQLADALESAGLRERLPMATGAPRAFRLVDGLYISHAGTDRKQAARLVEATLRKSRLPEPLRIAHLVARALVTGESRGRV
ncbi:MAG: DUF99 family protein [Myxococcales bacterium]|nr:DUF99 family protein [Myxococcales bacterium]